MQKKKMQILEAAVRLFARQGFHATSIQEIVDEVGMAKGSVYFYFKSKDELLLSIFEYYGERMVSGMAEHPGEEGLSSRERLRLQLERQFRFLKEHADFFQMLMKEPLAGMHQEQLKTLVFRFRSRFLEWLYRHVQAIYGAEAERYWADGVLLLEGIMGTYSQGVLIDSDSIEDGRLAHFLVQRLDDMMRGMAEAGEAPIMQHSGIRKIVAFGSKDSEEESVLKVLNELKVIASGSVAKEAIGLLEAELNKAVPHPTIVRSLLALLEKHAEPDWRKLLKRLAGLVESTSLTKSIP